jgi:hypothetical protein
MKTLYDEYKSFQTDLLAIMRKNYYEDNLSIFSNHLIADKLWNICIRSGSVRAQSKISKHYHGIRKPVGIGRRQTPKKLDIRLGWGLSIIVSFEIRILKTTSGLRVQPRLTRCKA